jgi:hypothetical protein
MIIVSKDSLLSVVVPDQMHELFAIAQQKVDKYFSMCEEDHLSGCLKLGNNRHVMLRGDALAYGFFQTIYDIYGNTKYSNEVGLSLMFDLAHAAGTVDAKKFHQIMHLSDPLEKLSVGPIYYAYTGFARVVIHANSNPVNNDDSESDLLTISKKIIDEINKPITYQHHQLQVGISIGASCWVGGQSYNLEKLLAIADYAMYQAKQAGKNKVRLGKI